MQLEQNLLKPIEKELEIVTKNILTLVKKGHPILFTTTKLLFNKRGKQLRPAIVILVSKATTRTNNINFKQSRLAEIIEIIHTASLIHDDVLDDAILRRGVPTIHSNLGTKIAILAGDFLFAQSSWYLASLENLEVIKLISKVISDFAEGEIRQGLNLFNDNLSINQYIEKSFYKTASLVAASAKSAAILSEVDMTVANDFYDFGRNLGIAFQIIDDILDFTQQTKNLGKPADSDLLSGNLTAPILLTLKQNPDLIEIINKKIKTTNDINKIKNIVIKTKGVDQAKELAQEYINVAIKCLPKVSQKNDPYIATLKHLSHYVLDRTL
uniref:Prenyl transferase n=1 Tax=Gloeochaete wittrockiana TaxID=38269 RepID=A0A3G1IWA3_9EUKA|nr:prenyl transferase [Gloeochaete wittrockiana]ASQ40229.1 prenyl transferase [Gloeochaete wittrockiana]